MWSITTSDLPRTGNYAEALRVFEKTAPIRGDTSGKKPLGNRRAMHKNFRKLDNGDIACCLYSTDVVVFHTDNSVTLDHGHWSTTSTNGFANAVLGWGSGLTCNFPAVAVTTPTKERRVYKLKQAARFVREGDGWIVADPSQLDVWEDYYIDKAKALSVVRTSGLKEFLVWRETRIALGTHKHPGVWTADSWCTLLLAGKELWPELAWRCTDLDDLRKQVYQHFDCIRVVEREWIHLHEWASVLNRERKWS